MKVAALYSSKDGDAILRKDYKRLFEEIESVICAVKADDHITKVSKEKTMVGKMLYSPPALNQAFKKAFHSRGWKSVRVKCEYSEKYYRAPYSVKSENRGAFREMDFVKGQVGVEVQLGKYAFMVYNVCAKMTIFKNLGHIKCGVEVVPVKQLADKMSTGVSYFEQIAWDLDQRGIADIDIPFVVLGVCA